MKLESSLFRSNPASESLKTTVPRAIALTLGLTENDYLEWTLIPTDDGIAALVKPRKGGTGA